MWVDQLEFWKILIIFTNSGLFNQDFKWFYESLSVSNQDFKRVYNIPSFN